MQNLQDFFENWSPDLLLHQVCISNAPEYAISTQKHSKISGKGLTPLLAAHT